MKAATNVPANFGKDFSLSGDISPAALTADVNDYAPTGIGDCAVLRLDSGTASYTVSGIAGGRDGRVLVVLNVGTTEALVFSSANTNSAAANRFLFSTDEIALRVNGCLTLWYDATSSRWRAVSVI